jgi:hypothetical protein
MGSLLFVAHRVFPLHHSRCSESADGGLPSLLGGILLKHIPLLGLSFRQLADSIPAASRLTAGAQ